MEKPLVCRPLRTADLLAPFLENELPRFQEALELGALLVFDRTKIRLRPLPLNPDQATLTNLDRKTGWNSEPWFRSSRSGHPE